MNKHKGQDFERLNSSIRSHLKMIAQYEDNIESGADNCQGDSVHISNEARKAKPRTSDGDGSKSGSTSGELPASTER